MYGRPYMILWLSGICNNILNLQSIAYNAFAVYVNITQCQQTSSMKTTRWLNEDLPCACLACYSRPHILPGHDDTCHYFPTLWTKRCLLTTTFIWIQTSWHVVYAAESGMTYWLLCHLEPPSIVHRCATIACTSHWTHDIRNDCLVKKEVRCAVV